MGATSSVSASCSIGGYTAVQNTAVAGDGLMTKEVSVPAAKTGTLSTRTNNTDGTLTMDAGHGFVTSTKIDLYWSGGQRLGVVPTVTVNSVAITGGSGDNLPIATTPITAMVPQSEQFAVAAANLNAMVFTAPAIANASFIAADTTTRVGSVRATSIQGGYIYPLTGETTPLTGDAATVLLSHGEVSAKTLAIAVIFS